MTESIYLDSKNVIPHFSFLPLVMAVINTENGEEIKCILRQYKRLYFAITNGNKFTSITDSTQSSLLHTADDVPVSADIGGTKVVSTLQTSVIMNTADVADPLYQNDGRLIAVNEALCVDCKVLSTMIDHSAAERNAIETEFHCPVDSC